MINEVTVPSNVASFGPGPNNLSNLSANVFIYGANGSGKTTISRLLAGGDAGQVTWTDRQLEVFRLIFEHSGHEARYRMMLGLDDEESTTDFSAVATSADKILR